jgi:hypothetical protein
MSHTTIWRNRDRHVDLTPGVLHDEALGGAGRWSERVAVLDAATGDAIAYGDLADRARRFAAGLRARGARPGDVLSLVASNGPDFPVAMHGALGAGLTLAPASPLLTARELGAFLRQVGARFLVADVGARSTAAEAARAAGVEAVLALESLPAGEPAALEAVDPGAIALLMSSSGTTGLPKSATHTHGSAVAMLRGFAAFPLTRLGPDDVVAGVIPMAHTFGSVLLNSTLRGGARIVTLTRFELEAFLSGAGAPRDRRRRGAAAGAGPRASPPGRSLRPLVAAPGAHRRRAMSHRDRARVPGAPGMRRGPVVRHDRARPDRPPRGAVEPRLAGPVGARRRGGRRRTR